MIFVRNVGTFLKTKKISLISIYLFKSQFLSTNTTFKIFFLKISFILVFICSFALCYTTVQVSYLIHILPFFLIDRTTILLRVAMCLAKIGGHRTQVYIRNCKIKYATNSKRVFPSKFFAIFFSTKLQGGISLLKPWDNSSEDKSYKLQMTDH